jgi:DNA (cytosine-5)-methyltransferase 1
LPRFIDLFAGIGGLRIAFEKEGFQCVYSSEINTHCQMVYENNFAENPTGDVTQIDIDSIPEFDILLAGFPCQSFSVSGLRRGFDDTRGTLFFDIARIVDKRKPPLLVLENVKGLVHHDKGNTLKVILEILESFEYQISYKVLNAKDFGVPQNRERIFIVASQKTIFDFSKLKKTTSQPLKYFLDQDGDFEFLNENEYTIIETPKVQKSGLKFIGYRNKNLFKRGIRENTEHLSRVHKQPNRIYSIEGYHPTLPSQETSGRFFIYDEESRRVRKLTVDECYRIMGYDDDFKKSSVRGEAYKQIGNSVAIPVVRAIAKEIKNQGLV